MAEPTDIAIVGMACRFPGADDLAQYWELLKFGRIGLTEYPRGSRADNYVPLRGVMSDAFAFDASFFGYAPSEALAMDPQHRVFLQTAWHAMEHAGLSPDDERRVGVYASCGRSTYSELWRRQAGLDERLSDTFAQLLGNSPDFLATRVSFKLDLRGPSLDVQSACSSSLVAVYLGCQSLADFTCDAALAGGVAVVFPQEFGYHYEPGMIASPDGQCRAFDASSAGCGFGNGVGVVTLKRLADAIDQRDHIWAVIRGFGLNNDGANKIGFTAPSSRAQAAVIRDAHAMARFEPSSIDYVETHGTGTPVGDPIEFEGLREAFSGVGPGHSCALGSVKANLGHLDSAAGVAGLIKTALLLAHRALVPHPTFKRANPALNMDASPFWVPTVYSELPREKSARAGVSSFGLGGTNVHLVLEQPQQEEPRAFESDGVYTLRLSAKGPAALGRSARQLASHLETHPEQALEGVEWSLRDGRQHHSHRLAVVARSRAEFVGALRSAKAIQGVAEGVRPVVFLFPGGGAQHARMGGALWERCARFREDVEDGIGDFSESLHEPIRAFFAGASSAEPASPTAALAALFIHCFALVEFLRRDGLRPAAMLGHSLGEYVAACVAGVMTRDVAAQLVEARGRLLEEMEPGGMLSVSLSATALRERLGEGLYLAVDNAPSACVVSGRTEAIERLGRQLAAEGVEWRKLRIGVASHCPLVRVQGSHFEQILRKSTLTAPKVPYLSNVTGDWAAAEDVTRPEYWLEHLTQQVQMGRALAKLLADPRRLFLEVGPGQSMTALLRLNAASSVPVVALATQPHALDDTSSDDVLRQARAAVWVNGGAETPPADHLARKVPLPVYPFEASQFRPKVTSGVSSRVAVTADVRAMFYAPSWRASLAAWGEFPQQVALWGEDESVQTCLRQALSQTTEVVKFEQADLKVSTSVVAVLSQRFDNGEFEQVVSLVQRLSRNGGGRLVVWAPGCARIEGHHAPQPMRAMLRAVALVAGQEDERLSCCLIDDAERHPPPATVASYLLAELRAQSTARVVAWRGGVRFEPDVTPLPPGVVGSYPSRLEQGGTYVIAGGFGRVGRTIACWLASHYQARLGLLGRRVVGEEQNGFVREIQKSGGGALAVQADVTDQAAVCEAVERVRAAFGPIAGVFHAAGVSSGSSLFRPLVELEAADWTTQLAPKALGMSHLDAAVGTDALRVFISSNATVLGGLGLGAYAAALHHAEALGGLTGRWRCVTWDGWPTGDEAQVEFGIQQFALNATQAGEALEAAIALPHMPVMCVSRGDLKARAATWIHRADDAPEPSERGAGSDEPLAVEAAPSTETEQRLARMWGELLGIAEVDVNTSFFLLGGHSLLATRLMSRVREEFQVQLGLKSFFEGPTIAMLAARVEEERFAGADPGVLAGLLNELEGTGA